METYNYSYPNGLNLEPASSEHVKLLSMLLSNLDRGYSNISSKCHPKWSQLDYYLSCFELTKDRYIKYFQPKAESTSNDDSVILIPYSLAVLETILAQTFTAINRANLFTYSGVDSDDAFGAALLEMIIGHDVKRNDVALNLHTAIRDDLVYGVAVTHPTYRKDKGNFLVSIDPYRYIPDPSVPLHAPQEGTFVAWSDSSTLFNQIRLEKMDKGYFNGKYLKNYSGGLRSRFVNRSRFVDEFWSEHSFDRVHVYCDLFPDEWGLSESSQPERWYFCLCGDSTIIGAKKLNLKHGDFPIAVGSSVFDGHSFAGYSKLSTLMGMQSVIDWLISSHITNVRQSIFTKFLIDPSMVNPVDVASGSSVIRTRKFAWGRGVDGAMKQLQVYDTTQSHIKDTGYFSDIMKTVAGTDDAAMGILRQSGPDRLTSTEASNAYSGLQSRLGRVVTVLAMQLLKPIGRQFAHNTIQLMPEKTYVRLAGRFAEQLAKTFQRRSIPIFRESIDVAFDVDVDADILSDNDKFALIRAFEMLTNNQELAGTYDIGKVFAQIMRANGIKNVEDYLKRNNQEAVIVPDQMLPTPQQMEEANGAVDAGQAQFAGF